MYGKKYPVGSGRECSNIQESPLLKGFDLAMHLIVAEQKNS
jgi:hypothetical protein